MRKLTLLLSAVLFMCATVSLSAQKKSCSSSMSIEECAAKMGVTVEEAKAICGDKASTKVASASIERIVDLPACCYSSLTENGKACCEKSQSALASAEKLVDVDGNEVKKYKCAWSSKMCTRDKSETKVASVVMVREQAQEKIATKQCKKTCAKTCASKKTSKA